MSNRAMEEEEKPKGFKVEDRRRFSAEGEARPEAETGPEEVLPEAETRLDSKEAPPSGRTSAPQGKQTGGAQTQFRTEPGSDRGRGERSHLGRLVGEHDDRVAHCELGMADLSVGAAQAKQLFRAEDLLVELDGFSSAFHHQVACD